MIRGIEVDILSKGKILQVIGPVVDVQFPVDKKLPDINNALHVKNTNGLPDEDKLKAALKDFNEGFSIGKN